MAIVFFEFATQDAEACLLTIKPSFFDDTTAALI